MRASCDRAAGPCRSIRRSGRNSNISPHPVGRSCARRLPLASGFRYEERHLCRSMDKAEMSETTPARLLGMSGSLRNGSYSNAVLETLREKFDGRADLRIYDLQPIPPTTRTSKAKSAPGPVKALLAAIAESDGLVLCAPGIQPQHSRRLEKRARLGLAPRLHLGDGVQAGGDNGDLARAARRRALPGAHARGTRLDAGARHSGARGDDHRIRRQGQGWPACRRDSLGFACAAVEALLREIRLWRMADGLAG